MCPIRTKTDLQFQLVRSAFRSRLRDLGQWVIVDVYVSVTY